jgi:hypothetical protein
VATLSEGEREDDLLSEENGAFTDFGWRRAPELAAADITLVYTKNLNSEAFYCSEKPTGLDSYKDYSLITIISFFIVICCVRNSFYFYKSFTKNQPLTHWFRSGIQINGTWEIRIRRKQSDNTQNIQKNW